jgi:hypothetical protein
MLETMRKPQTMKSALLSALGFAIHGFSAGAAEIGDLVDVRCSVIFPTDQIHGNVVHVLCDESHTAVLKGDAFVTDRPGLVCHVRSADCVPILIADRARRVVAAVHAGWRGTAQDVVGQAILAMREAFGSHPGDMLAAIGPSICGACFEVGVEVVEQLEALDLGVGVRIGERHVDLSLANRALIERSGVPPGNIDLLPHCTSCDARFASWRRDRSGARQTNFIVISH